MGEQPLHAVPLFKVGKDHIRFGIERKISYEYFNTSKLGEFFFLNNFISYITAQCMETLELVMTTTFLTGSTTGEIWELLLLTARCLLGYTNYPVHLSNHLAVSSKLKEPTLKSQSYRLRFVLLSKDWLLKFFYKTSLMFIAQTV